MDKKGIITFSERELNILYFSISKEIQRKKDFLKMISNSFLLNKLQIEVTELQTLKNKVSELKNKLNNDDNIK